MATINLAPGSRYLVAARRQQQRLLLASGALALLLVGIWGGLYLTQRQLRKTQGVLHNQLASLNAQIEQLQPEAKRIVLFEGRLTVLDDLLNTHIDWNPLLADLEKFLLPTIVVGRVEMDSVKGVLTLTGSATDIDQVAQVVASLTNGPGHTTLFTQADLANVQEEVIAATNVAPTKRYKFSLSLTFDPAKLRRQFSPHG